MSDGMDDEDYQKRNRNYVTMKKPVPSGTQDERERGCGDLEQELTYYEKQVEVLQSLLDAERKRVQELEGALTGGYTILKALDISVKWELAPTIKQTIKEWCQQAESLLSKEQI